MTQKTAGTAAVLEARVLQELSKRRLPYLHREYNKPFSGVVINKSGTRTVMVLVKTPQQQRKYGNIIMQKKKYMCHDEHELTAIGDEVNIQKSKAYSKRKHWKIHSFVRREPTTVWADIYPDYNISNVELRRIRKDFEDSRKATRIKASKRGELRVAALKAIRDVDGTDEVVSSSVPQAQEEEVMEIGGETGGGLSAIIQQQLAKKNADNSSPNSTVSFPHDVLGKE